MSGDGSGLLVTPAWVEERLGRDGFRVIDAGVRFETKPVGASTIHSLRDDWLKGHIPGAAWLHMVDDLSDPDGAYPFTIAPQAQIDRLMSSIGIRPDDTIVVYGGGTPFAVARAWWVLSVSGCRDVRIMDGGWARWTAERRPVATGEESFEPSEFRGVRDDNAIAGRADIAAAIDDSTQIVNALAPAQHTGTGGTHYGRPGRIPGSVNIPAMQLQDPQTGDFASMADIRKAAEAVDPDRPVITYCGGGIAAASTLFALKLAGFEKLRLYDNSLLEWSADPDLPMERDG
ncbi:MAG: sulfurtransferase [Minwuia sp.]|uniref:sulfurtransferase n=1 Tax=Minwuia sp. TaxID=2493630 RepID=UPI003A8ACEE9